MRLTAIILCAASLGFGGWIIIGYNYPIMNDGGKDVRVIEDTWGTYPLEKADVYASQDGATWVWLGTADNTNFVGIHTISEFDLGSLAWAKYIKVVDVTRLEDFTGISGADGYDLNAVVAVTDCQEPVC